MACSRVGSCRGPRAGDKIASKTAFLVCSFQPNVETIRPEEGMLVLFPSYFYHRTIPFESAQQRICIAFDAIPRFGQPAR